MAVVLEISSDEEEGLEKGPKIADFDWIKKFLLTDDEESDDPDEVVIIGEKKPKLKSKSSTLVVKDIIVDDDDCVVLEGDPQNGVASVVEETNESDELLIVGEKGQIACRDYPHARHLCAKFPFSSTAHEMHCSQCHCYVCDSLAPCLKWGTGIMSSDHCHANDKTEQWKIQRKTFRLGQSSPLPASANHGTSLCAVYPQRDKFLPVDNAHLSPNSVLQNQASRHAAMCTFPELNSLPQFQASPQTTMCTLSPSLNSSVQNQTSRPINIPVMSTATNLAIPNDANRRCRESGSTLVRNRHQPHSVPRPGLGVRSHGIQRERGTCASSLRPQLLHPHIKSKGVGSAGDTLTMNKSSHASSGFNNRINETQQRDKYHTATGFSNYRNHNTPDDVCHPINLSLYSSLPNFEPISLSCVDKHTVASEMQAYSQPLPQSNDNQNFHQTSIQCNNDYAPSSYATCPDPNSNQLGNEPQIRILNENANRNITQCGTASQDTCQSKPHEESPSEAARRFPAFDSIWKNYTDESSGPLIECFPLQNSGSLDQKAPNAKESGTQFTGSNEPVIECSQLSTPLLDFENWFLDKDCDPRVTDGVLPSDLSIPSPDLDPVDMGMVLFYLDQGT